MEPSTVTVQRLSRDSLPQFLEFFDGDAFSDNTAWSSCYCQCFYENHDEITWSACTAERNRTTACDRITNAEMQGYLALDGGKPIGWCGAAPRRLLHALDDEPTPNAEDVGTIICFLVSPSHRGKGVARLLLDAACLGLRDQGMKIAEANPRPEAKTPAENHFGPLSLYLTSGFTVHREDTDGSIYVRRALGDA